jgi:hypothetical protein
MKIKRARIEHMSAPQIEQWYGNQKKVMWA